MAVRQQRDSGGRDIDCNSATRSGHLSALLAWICRRGESCCDSSRTQVAEKVQTILVEGDGLGWVLLRR